MIFIIRALDKREKLFTRFFFSNIFYIKPTIICCIMLIVIAIVGYPFVVQIKEIIEKKNIKSWCLIQKIIILNYTSIKFE